MYSFNDFIKIVYLSTLKPIKIYQLLLMFTHYLHTLIINETKIKKLSNKYKILGESLSHEGGHYIMENFYEIMTRESIYHGLSYEIMTPGSLKWGVTISYHRGTFRISCV